MGGGQRGWYIERHRWVNSSKNRCIYMDLYNNARFPYGMGLDWYPGAVASRKGRYIGVPICRATYFAATAIGFVYLV